LTGASPSTWLRMRTRIRYPSLLLCMLLTGGAAAQTTVPPDAELQTRRTRAAAKIDEQTKRVADSYLAILQQLADLTRDYGQFYAVLSTQSAKENFEALRTVEGELRRGRYNGDVRRLESQLRSLSERLKAQETELARATAERKLQSTTRVLRQELEAIRTLLDRDVARQLQDGSDKLLVVQAYLDAQTSRLQAESPLTAPPEPPEPVEEVETKELPEAPETPATSYPGAPQRPRTPQAVEPVKGPSVTTGRDITYLRPGGEAGLVREFTDSLRLPSTLTPVHISSPIGKVKIVTGIPGRVLARLEIEISADSQEKVRRIADQVVLQVTSRDGEVHIEPMLPNLEDPATRVVSASLTVSTSAINPVVCKSAFGEVTVSGLQGDVRIDGSNSRITVSSVSGNVEVSDHAGVVTIEKLTGNAKVKNAFGLINVIGCQGGLDLENSLAPIVVSQSTGEARIRNTGDVKVHNHRGRVTIKNSNGLVEVKNLSGSLLADNSFKPLLVEDVAGSIDVENSNAVIEARRIQGKVTADNRSGDIFAAVMGGPLNLSNHNGSIMVTLDDRLSGHSFITSAFGSVNIGLSPNLDLLLKAETLGGSITSSIPVSVTEKDSLQTAELVLGTAANSLTISGRHAIITISEAH
jgi:DUF4097 and DUF4098 domain-containing protein YvlB